MVMPLQNLKNRNELAELLKKLGLVGRAVEIGVAEGDFSCYLLDRWPGACYQVDIWTELNAADYVDFCNVGQQEQDRRYMKVCERARHYHGRAIPLKMFSAQAARMFPDQFFDFVYIDANHKLEFAREDIALWYPKVKTGGIFAGHDYLDGVISSGEYGVKTAVTEFAASASLTVNVTQEQDYPSWWVRKLV